MKIGAKKKMFFNKIKTSVATFRIKKKKKGVIIENFKKINKRS